MEIRRGCPGQWTALLNLLLFLLAILTPPFMLACKSLQSCAILCDPMDCSLPRHSVHGISQARILESVALLPPVDLPDPGIKPASLMSPALAGRSFTAITTWEALTRTDNSGCLGLATLIHLRILCMHAKLLQLHPWGHKETKLSDFHNVSFASFFNDNK